MNNHDIAAILDEIGVLLALKGENPFKIRAYQNAARTIDGLTQDLKKLIQSNRLQELPGIGDHIAKKIATLVEKGRLPYYEALKRSIPKGLLELLSIPGLGPKKVTLLYKKLKIKSITQLEKSCREGRIAKLPGFGTKTQTAILNNISKLQSYSKRMLWWDAFKIAQPILHNLSKLKGVKKAEVAGSFRRKLETVGDLDFLVASSAPLSVMDWFVNQPDVETILAKGPTKSAVRLKEGVQADIRVIPEKEYAYALMYFTGSKEHNIHLRQLANKMGYKLNEYGLTPLKSSSTKLPRKKIPTEEAIFKALKLSYIPPEIREDKGEIEASAKNKLPVLVEEKQIRGAFHCHTTASDGRNTLEEMHQAAQALKWEYLGIADHSKSSVQAHGMDEKRLFAQIEQIRKINRSKKSKTHLFAGLECDILLNGKLDFPDRVLKELDYIVISIHRSFQLEERKMTARLIKAIENPYSTMVGHLTGRLLLRREPYALNTQKIIDACIANGKIIELNAHPMRLDMDWRLWIQAKEKGLKCCINPDAHSTADLQYFRAGVHIARKGWLEKDDIINTLSLSQVKKHLNENCH